jgi:DNA-directed RNA polymerase subunit RPC12/RpoP
MIYKCATCEKTFEGGWTDNEARDEARRIFPALDLENKDQSDPEAPVIVCDACYKKIMVHSVFECEFGSKLSEFLKGFQPYEVYMHCLVKAMFAAHALGYSTLKVANDAGIIQAALWLDDPK